ncbi:MAG: hypothetical protein MUP82_02700 [Candidatus Marinimicrobia bacterium]|nr:hypothetical protein [Candidatus Neomarinimicrobiota bacterium]
MYIIYNMPAKIHMIIPKGGYTPPQMPAAIKSPNTAIAPKAIPTALNSTMIARIHTVKPGCGSCGRH